MPCITLPGSHGLGPHGADASQGRPPAEGEAELVLLQIGLAETREALAELTRQMGQQREGGSPAMRAAFSAVELQGLRSELDLRSSQQLDELNSLRSSVEESRSRICALETSLSGLRCDLAARWERQEMQAASMLEEHLSQTDALDMLVRSQDQHKQETAALQARLEAVERRLEAAGPPAPPQPAVCGGHEPAPACSPSLEPALEAVQARLGALAAEVVAQVERLERMEGACAKGEPPQDQRHRLDAGVLPELVRDTSPWSGSTTERGSATTLPSDGPEAGLMDVGAWLARLVGEMEAGLRVELSSRLHKLSGELRSQVLAEVASAEARSDRAQAGLRADFQRVAGDLSAKLAASRAVTPPPNERAISPHRPAPRSPRPSEEPLAAAWIQAAAAQACGASNPAPQSPRGAVARAPTCPGTVRPVAVLCTDEPPPLPPPEDTCRLPQRNGSEAAGALRRPVSPLAGARPTRCSQGVVRSQSYEQPPSVLSAWTAGPPRQTPAAPAMVFGKDATPRTLTARAQGAMQITRKASLETFAHGLMPAQHQPECSRDGISRAGHTHAQQHQQQPHKQQQPQKQQQQPQQLQRQQHRRQQQEQQRQQQHRCNPPVVAQTQQIPLRRPSLGPAQVCHASC